MNESNDQRGPRASRSLPVFPPSPAVRVQNGARIEVNKEFNQSTTDASILSDTPDSIAPTLTSNAWGKPSQESLTPLEAYIYDPEKSPEKSPASGSRATSLEAYSYADLEKRGGSVGRSTALLLGEPPLKTRTITGWKWLVTCFTLYVTVFLYGLDNTIVADIQAPIVEKFGQVEKVAWLGSGFPLGSMLVILTLGKFYGLFDGKWIYIISVATFEAGSALSGAAPSIDMLIVGRVWAGIGAGGMYLG